VDDGRHGPKAGDGDRSSASDLCEEVRRVSPTIARCGLLAQYGESEIRKMEAPRYLHLRPGDAPPGLASTAYYKAVVVVDSEVTPEWQAQISNWLVRSGCLYMMAWGRKCSEWDDSVDVASLHMHGNDEVFDEDLVMTTWHEDESLEDTFWFAERCAWHPTSVFEYTLVVHIALENRESEILKIYRAAQERSV
jgi:hypothetical protein